jgi:hypothetical protein
MDRHSHRNSRKDWSNRDEFDRKTKLNRDNSTRPSQPQQHRDEPSREYLDQRTKLIRDQAKGPSQSDRDGSSRNGSDQRTKLNRDHSTRPSESQRHRDESSRVDVDQRTKLNRDHSRPSQSQQHRNKSSRDDVGQRTKLIRDQSRPSQSHYHRQESSHAPSILRANIDETMASRQIRIKTLLPAERQEQERWAQKQIQLTGACVGNRPWTRVDGGYRCASGNCKITDELLSEGGGGWVHAMPRITTAFPNLFDESKITWVGPYYRGHLGNSIQAPVPGFIVGFP